MKEVKMLLLFISEWKFKKNPTANARKPEMNSPLDTQRGNRIACAEPLAACPHPDSNYTTPQPA